MICVCATAGLLAPAVAWAQPQPNQGPGLPPLQQQMTQQPGPYRPSVQSPIPPTAPSQSLLGARPGLTTPPGGPGQQGWQPPQSQPSQSQPSQSQPPQPGLNQQTQQTLAQPTPPPQSNPAQPVPSEPSGTQPNSSPPDVQTSQSPPEPAPEPPNVWLPAGTAKLQALDKVNAQASELTVKVGQTATFGSLNITVKSCVVRPRDQPADAAAYVNVIDSHPDQEGFNGWLLANEPSVSMMQNPVYDLRIIGCT
jgi:hypothetical protein